MQFINELLYKELNSGTSMNTLDEWTRPTARSQVSTFKCNHDNSRRSEALHSSQPVSVTNRFSVLAKLPDPTTRNEETPPEGRPVDGSSYNYKRKQNQKRQSMRNNVNNYHGRTPVEHPTDSIQFNLFVFLLSFYRL